MRSKDFIFLAILLSISSGEARSSKPKRVVDDGSYSPTVDDGNFQAPASGALTFQGKFALYQDGRAGRALCVPPASNPESVLRRNGISTNGRVSSAEKAALAKGIAQIEKLLGKPLPASWRTNFNFISASGTWNQATNGINVRRIPGSTTGLLTGRMMHELGHKVGNSGAYSKYIASTGGKICKITPYAARGSKSAVRSNEEFSEAFEAYVVFPDLLKAQCPKSYAFFANKLFPNSEDKVASCKGSTLNDRQDTNGNRRHHKNEAHESGAR